MTSARYLVRFDDLCPAMNWDVWNAVERALIEAGVSPILAVVPDNQDTDLQWGPCDPEFWSRVRGWQARGWAIGVHGYQHRLDRRHSSLLGRSSGTEFGGLAGREQRRRIEFALEIFRREGVRPDLWVTPAHNSDAETLAALSDCGVHCISDGFALYPYRDAQGMLWVPQQLWRFRPMPAGVWTICFHHNRWTGDVVAAFRRDIKSFHKEIVTLQSIRERFDTSRKRPIDSFLSLALPLLLRVRLACTCRHPI
jgi:predicted deacetylase